MNFNYYYGGTLGPGTVLSPASVPTGTNIALSHTAEHVNINEQAGTVANDTRNMAPTSPVGTMYWIIQAGSYTVTINGKPYPITITAKTTYTIALNPLKKIEL